jgi:uncharacterized alpha-E superfamily protein
MLSRAAESLFWMGRYVERMDNVARLIDAMQAMAGMSEGEGEWDSALIAAGCEDFAAKHPQCSQDDAVRHLACDPENASSILRCIEAARWNARAMRTAVTRDMWDTLNGARIEMRKLGDDAFGPERLATTLEWARAVAKRFYGAYSGTMLRNEMYWFTRLGTFIERADNTARILDVKYHVLLPRDEGVGGAVDYYQWTTVLRAVSAVRAYHWVYRSEVVPWHVAELLMLRPEMPRSLRFCYDEIETTLAQIAESHDGRTGECHVLAGALAGKLRASKIAEVLRAGLHEEITSIVQDAAKLGEEIAAFYMR